MKTNKFNCYDEQIIPLLHDGVNETTIARKLLNSDVGGTLNIQVKVLSEYIRRHKKRLLDTHEGFYEATNQVDIPISSARNMWIKTQNKEGLNFSVLAKNPFFQEPEKEVEKEIDFLSIFKNKIKPIELPKVSIDNDKHWFDRLVYTDTHIGMEVNKDGYSLYDGVWNEEEINTRLRQMVIYTILNKKSDTLHIHELGDFMDGYNAITTRGGHELPQNMDNQKAFDVGLQFKIKLIDSLVPHFNKIVCVNICNDNHAGSFGYIVNSAFKTYIELKYTNRVEVINQRKFIDHYIVGNRCFILTHGKDDKNLKFGFKPQLDAIQIEKIKNYIDEYKLHSYKIEFSKGDSHQLLLDFTSSTSFEYQNFGAFSPPSDWVKTNFKNTNSSFIHFNYYDKNKTINPYIF